VTLPEGATDRVPAGADRPLTYELLVELAALRAAMASEG
jgi:hypothetical protein